MLLRAPRFPHALSIERVCEMCIRPRGVLSQKFVLSPSLDSWFFLITVLAPCTSVRIVPCFMCRGQGCPQSCLPKGNKAAEQRASGSNAAAGKQSEAATTLEVSAEPSAGSQPPRCAALFLKTHCEAHPLLSALSDQPFLFAGPCLWLPQQEAACTVHPCCGSGSVKLKPYTQPRSLLTLAARPLVARLWDASRVRHTVPCWDASRVRHTVRSGHHNDEADPWLSYGCFLQLFIVRLLCVRRDVPCCGHMAPIFRCWCWPATASAYQK